MRLKLHSIAVAALCGVAGASPAPAFQAQPQGNTQVGPAEVRDFSLPGTQPPAEREGEPATPPETPPADERPKEPVSIPAPAAPTVAQPAPVPPPRETRPLTPAPRPQPEAATDQPEQDRGSDERLPATTDVREAIPDAPAQTPAEAPSAAAEPESTDAPSPVSRQPGEQADEGSGWLFPLLAALALVGGAIAVLRLRRRREQEELEAEPALISQPEPQPDPRPEPEPAPTPLPQPEPAMAAALAAAAAAPASDVPGVVMRPWLELVFKPARATATDGGASVQYEAVIRNVGNAPARNVRLAARMFNSGQDIQDEVSRFFAMGVDSPDGAPLTILPRTEVSLSSVVTMARDEMREIKVQGRSLFIPTVAFNLLYDWGRDKVGQTCSAHVVGREPEPPAEKMAPFRLDLGPRVYRSVGQRPSALARAV